MSERSDENGEEEEQGSISIGSDDDYVDFEEEGDSDESISVVTLSDGEEDKKNQAVDRIPLIPLDFSSIVEAMENFAVVFDSRYGPNCPTFYQGSLQDALTEAFEAPGREIVERRPLAIYLHDDDQSTVASNIFAKNVICSNEVSSLLKRQFVLWAWDMTEKVNRRKLYEWFALPELAAVNEALKVVHRSKYPILAVVVKQRNQLIPITISKGHDTPARSVQKLMAGLDIYIRIKNDEAAEKQKKEEWERVREQQKEEYEKSLSADRAKQEELAMQRQLDEANELERERKEEQRQIRQAMLASSLPTEPGEGEPNLITVCMRFPSGEQKKRHFRKSEPLQLLVTYVESVGYAMEDYQIWTSDIPRKDVCTELDTSKTFSELNWSCREKVIIDEK